MCEWLKCRVFTTTHSYSRCSTPRHDVRMQMHFPVYAEVSTTYSVSLDPSAEYPFVNGYDTSPNNTR